MTAQSVKAQGVDLLGVGSELFPNKRNIKGKEDFGSIMDKSLEQSVSNQKKKTEKSVPKMITPFQRVDDKAEVNLNELSEQKTGSAEKTQDFIEKEDHLLTPEETELLQEINTTIKDIVKEKLEIDEIQLEKLMSQATIPFLGLFYPENQKQLVLENANADDVTAILTDYDLSEQFTQLTTALETNHFAEDFGVSEEELKQLLDKATQLESTFDMLVPDEGTETKLETKIVNEKVFSEANQVFTISSEDENSKLPEDNVVVLEPITDNEVQEQDSIQNTAKAVLAEEETKNLDFATKESVTLSVADDQQDILATQKVKDTDEKQRIPDKGLSEEVIVVTQEKQPTKEYQESNSSEHKQHEFKQTENKGLSLEQFVQNLSNSNVELPEQFTNQVEHLEQMRHIVNQVVEQIKIVMKPETTSMELQLNPENLGKVSLSVVAKAGQITASIVTQNELAKHAIESQMQVLKENLSEQGIKVNAIEVTVSNFEFGQNQHMNKGNQQDHQKRQTRRINLEHLEAGISQLDEEEQLAVKIMEANGGHVDYTA